MGLDAEEGLAHDDKRRDVEDEVRGQVVEVQAVVEYEPPNERVKRKTQSAEEMGKKNNPLMGPGGGDELPTSGSRMAMSLDKYPAFLRFSICPSVMEEAIHLPPAPDMVGEG